MSTPSVWCWDCGSATDRPGRRCPRCRTARRRREPERIGSGAIGSVNHGLPSTDLAPLLRRHPELRDVLDTTKFVSRLTKYRIRVGQWAFMVLKQDARCAICQRKVPPLDLCIDHCHESEKVRGLLCSSCNTGLGLLGIDGDASARLAAIASYMRARQKY